MTEDFSSDPFSFLALHVSVRISDVLTTAIVSVPLSAIWIPDEPFLILPDDDLQVYSGAGSPVALQ